MDATERLTNHETDETEENTTPKDTATFENVEKHSQEIPRYAGGTIRGVYACGRDTQAIYVADTTKAAFDAYCALLEAEGYLRYCDNVIGENAYATYTGEKRCVHVYYLHNLKEARLISAPMSPAVLPPAKSGIYSKVTNSIVTLMALDITAHEDNGLGIVVTLEDGSYIIVDGGYEEDAPALYQYLVENNRRPDGKLVIAAWVLTHGHGDHYFNFRRFVSTYSSQVTLEYVLVNDAEIAPDFTRTILSALQAFEGARLLKPHTGQRFPIRNAMLEVLFTPEDLHPYKAEEEPFNNTGTVLRMTLAGQTFLIPGDVETRVNDMLCGIYGEHLKSDIMQVPHHGHPAGTIEFYNYVDPSVVLYSVSRHGFKRVKVLDPNVHLLDKLHVGEVVIADASYPRTLVLPYTPDKATKE